jgi:hypothetical protein
VGGVSDAEFGHHKISGMETVIGVGDASHRTYRLSMKFLALSLFAFASVTFLANAAETIIVRAQVVVYGDTSGGVAAAVQAARMGKDTVLISPVGHLGGMTSSGLGWTDIGRSAILGGIAREFYHRVYLHYQGERAWKWEKRSDFKNEGQGAPALDNKTQLAMTFEPHVAEAVFDGLLKEAGVRVVKGCLDLKNGAAKDGRRITALRLESGALIEGDIFIDASYEGDLLPAAGVSFRVGREANAEFNETGNGNTGPRDTHQMPDGVDPYVVAGDASSGLLPGVNASIGGPLGSTDERLQSYCYRLTLTDVPANRISIDMPEGYREEDYELLFRAIEAGHHWPFFTTSWMPNRKTDTNNNGGVSMDYIGGNYLLDESGKTEWSWVTLDHVGRERVAIAHKQWQLGLLWTLQNHPRVPAEIRKRVAQWGLAADEYEDNGNWPYAIYVREGRRMASDFVMTEDHCRNNLPIDDPIGMGAYTLDSHNTQRCVVDGVVRNEGDAQLRLTDGPYKIAYRAITPHADECENLLVPWALSSTHIAFGSIRMEPVFMILSQSAATAASLAIDEKVAVQEVSYERLRERLLMDDQRLDTVAK